PRLQGAQPGGEPVAGRARVPRDRVEPLVAEDDLAHGEQRPLLADQVQGGRHGAGPTGQFLNAHGSKTTSVAKSNLLGLRSRRRSLVGFSNQSQPEGWRVAESAADGGASGLAGDVRGLAPAPAAGAVASGLAVDGESAAPARQARF